jgi:hypothetical protein
MCRTGQLSVAEIQYGKLRYGVRLFGDWLLTGSARRGRLRWRPC